jgi:hypothetical protein
MSGRSERLEQKHPEVGHEVAGDAVVRVVKQNSHDTPLKHSLATLSPSRRSRKAGVLDVSLWLLVAIHNPINVGNVNSLLA